MDSKNATGGVKVTYIETQFITSDAAGFKDLVQRLTGRSSSAAPLPPPPPHRPRPCRPADNGRRGTTAAAAGPAAGSQQAYHYTVAEVVRPPVTVDRTPTTYLDDVGLHDYIDMGDFSDLLCVVGASERSDGCYGDFPYLLIEGTELRTDQAVYL